jgi:hypothetical protein
MVQLSETLLVQILSNSGNFAQNTSVKINLSSFIFLLTSQTVVGVNRVKPVKKYLSLPVLKGKYKFLSQPSRHCPAKHFTHVPWAYSYPRPSYSFSNVSCGSHPHPVAVSSAWKNCPVADQYSPTYSQLRNQFLLLVFPCLLHKIIQGLFTIILVN